MVHAHIWQRPRGEPPSIEARTRIVHAVVVGGILGVTELVGVLHLAAEDRPQVAEPPSHDAAVWQTCAASMTVSTAVGSRARAKKARVMLRTVVQHECAL